jgi:DtxR family Mn-dependent transcriptional regulator
MQDPVFALSVFLVSMLLIYGIWRLTKLPFLLKNKQQKEKMLIEDILKQLYHVEYSGRSASLNDMAGAMKQRHEKLVALLEKASDFNLIRNENGNLQLTTEGKAYALRIIRNHRLWEKYLSEKTGIDKLEWHSSAEKMEHLMNTDDSERLSEELGNPRFDPHGDPIPTVGGEIIEVKWMPLSSLKEGVPARIVHIEDEPAVIYKQIANKLYIGSQVKVIKSDDSSIEVFSEGETYTFTPIVASNISAVELHEQEIFEENAGRLTNLEQGERARILGISSECRGASRRRLLDLGFIPGTEIEPEFTSPMEDPRAYLIRNTLIALRNDQADLVLIEKV